MELDLSNGMKVKANFNTGMLVFTTKKGRKVYLGTDIQEAFLEFVEIAKEVEETTSVYSAEHDGKTFFFGSHVIPEALDSEKEYNHYMVTIPSEDIGVILHHTGDIPEGIITEDREEAMCHVYTEKVPV